MTVYEACLRPELGAEAGERLVAQVPRFSHGRPVRNGVWATTAGADQVEPELPREKREGWGLVDRGRAGRLSRPAVRGRVSLLPEGRMVTLQCSVHRMGWCFNLFLI